MNYASIKNCDIANGEGVRVTLFVSGCTNHCENCFQPETWDFGYGEPFTPAVEDRLIEMLRPGFINGLTLLGGEPMEPQNQRALLPFLRRVRKELPEKTMTPELLSLLDVLVDGRFVQALYDISLRFRGSSNQRIIDVPKTLESGNLTLWQG